MGALWGRPKKALGFDSSLVPPTSPPRGRSCRLVKTLLEDTNPNNDKQNYQCGMQTHSLSPEDQEGQVLPTADQTCASGWGDVTLAAMDEV